MTYTIDGAIRFLHDQIKETNWQAVVVRFDPKAKSPSLTVWDKNDPHVHTNDEGLPNKYEHTIKGKPFDYEAALSKIWIVMGSDTCFLNSSVMYVVEHNKSTVTLLDVQTKERLPISPGYFRELIEKHRLEELNPPTKT